jgi:hypothetical protein
MALRGSFFWTPVLRARTREDLMNEQETQKQDTVKQEADKQETVKIVELNAEETDQVVGGNKLFREPVLRR